MNLYILGTLIYKPAALMFYHQLIYNLFILACLMGCSCAIMHDYYFTPNPYYSPFVIMAKLRTVM